MGGMDMKRGRGSALTYGITVNVPKLMRQEAIKFNRGRHPKVSLKQASSKLSWADLEKIRTQASLDQTILRYVSHLPQQEKESVSQWFDGIVEDGAIGG